MKLNKKAIFFVFGTTLSVVVSGLIFAEGNQAVTGSIEYTASSPMATWSGKNGSMNGSISLSPPAGKVCIKQSEWNSKNAKRDAHTKDMFQVGTFPEACFVPEKVEGNLSNGSVVLHGILTMNGAKQNISVAGNLRTNNGKLHFEGTTSLKLTDYQITRPSIMGIQVEDQVNIKIIADGGKR